METPLRRGGEIHDPLISPGSFLVALQEELGGTIPFERFMAEALYNPSFGYYTTRIQTVGRRGDFSTMATLPHGLAQAIASWLNSLPPATKPLHLIEVGAGTGQLAHDTLAALGWWKRLRLRYHIVEVSPPLLRAQKALLRGHRIQWHPSLPAALEAADGHAHLFSNELPDAFPCRIFERTAQDWLELHLRIAGGRIEEILLPANLPESTVFAHPLAPGCRVEVHESYHRWLQAWAPAWKSGAMLTIDYGDLLPGLYHRRPRGTLRAYAAHQRLVGDDIYQAPGRCDLTADVNFSDLEKWSTALGWVTTASRSLSAILPHQAAGFFRILQVANNFPPKKISPPPSKDS